jgi:predicted transcriptional regulator
MFFYLKWYIKKRAFISGLEEHRTEIARLIVDIDSVTDRNLQLVEDSISKLKALLENTEKRIEEYKNAIEIKPARETLYTSLGRGVRAALINPEKQPQLQTEHPLQSRQLSLEPQIFDEFHETPVKAESKITVKAAPPVQKAPSKKQIRNAIDSLANEGFSPEEIASRLEISIAQVNLALNLRRTKR